MALVSLFDRNYSIFGSLENIWWYKLMSAINLKRILFLKKKMFILIWCIFVLCKGRLKSNYRNTKRKSGSLSLQQIPYWLWRIKAQVKSHWPSVGIVLKHTLKEMWFIWITTSNVNFLWISCTTVWQLFIRLLFLRRFMK